MKLTLTIKTLAQIAAALLIVLVLLNWNNYFGSTHKEGFQDDDDSKKINPESSARVAYEYNDQTAGEYPTTIFERSMGKTFAKSPKMICSFIPTAKQSQCLTKNGSPIVKYKFPVHLCKLPNGKHLAVFNDGRLYIKTKLTDKLWSGPIKNSMPNRTVPLRMVTLNPAGDRLVAVGYDNKIYIKSSTTEAGDINLESEWEQIFGLEGYIFVMYSYDEESNINRMVLINTDGQVKITNSDKPKDGVTDFAVVGEPILKLVGDAEGYMMAIDTTFTLRTFDAKEWWASKFSRKFSGNPNKVCDVIYDRDQLLFGLVFEPKTGMVEVMKQEEPHILSPFVPFSLNRFLDSTTSERRLTDRMIIKSKLGVFTGQGQREEELLDDDINLAYQRQQLDDKKRLREFCQARGFNTSANYRDYSVMTEIDKNKAKINELNNVIQELTAYDPDSKPIQSAGDLPL